MKAYLLARVSTEEQKEALPAQTVRLIDYANKNAYDYELFEIQESAYKGERQQFQQVVDKIAEEKEKCLVVFDKIDRLTRDPYSPVYMRLIELYRSGRIDLHFPSDNLFLDQNSPAVEKMRLGLGVSLAEYYSASSSDNVKRRIDQMLKSGLWIAKAPFGYKNIRKDGKGWIELDPMNAEIVRYTFETYATGTSSLLAIKKDWFEKFGRKVTKGQLTLILNNPFYYGEMRVKGVLYPHCYETIISKELFDKVQAVFNGYNIKPSRWGGLPYAYRGLIYCSECGCKITFETKKGKYIYGHCTQYKYKHGAKYVSENEFTEQFERIIADVKIPDEVLKQAKEVIEQNITNSTQRIVQQRQALEAGIHQYKTRLSKMYDEHLDGSISSELYQQKYTEYSEAKQKLEKTLQNIELLDNKRLDNYSYLLELANKIPELFLKATFEEKRKLIKLLLSNLSLNKDLLGWEYKKPFDLMASCNKNANWCA